MDKMIIISTLMFWVGYFMLLTSGIQIIKEDPITLVGIIPLFIGAPIIFYWKEITQSSGGANK